MVDWTPQKLIRVAQTHDKKAARMRDGGEDPVPFDHTHYRKFAFDARQWARQKVNNE